MALSTQKNTQAFLLSVKEEGLNITVSAPLFFFQLLQQTLNGWEGVSVLFCEEPDIDVQTKGDQFILKTVLERSVPARKDIIDILNEFFLCLAYLMTAKIEVAKLVHCAAFSQDEKKIVIFGNKKAGKSSKVFEHAEAGAEILADDLLVWLPKRAEFMCIGLPLRMRRPVLGLDQIGSEKKRFIAGRQTAYAHKDAFFVRPAGWSFVPDKIYRLENRRMVSIPFLKWPKIIENHLISSEYTKLKG